MPRTPEPKKTKHSATHRDKCYEMEARYGWKLWKIDEHPEQEIMKVDCIFLGDAQFPKHWTEEDNNDD
ncbi:MAG: hypothetical protein WBD58_06155 [Geitlerinemataceae cyanobacterium]